MADILIVDDNMAFRHMLSRIVRSRYPHSHIREANDGNGAVKETENRVPDLIFMDVRLPGENGFELTRRIKAAHPDVVIIIITSYDSPEYREAAFDSGADFFLSKRTSKASDIMDRMESMFSPG